MKGWKAKLKSDNKKASRKNKSMVTTKYRCQTKQSFQSKTKALEALAEYKKGKGFKNLKKVYQCNICNEYHLTKG